MDSTGDLYVAFDAYCRHLWMSRADTDGIKAYYSYNQASFPRADTGSFYDLYTRKTLADTCLILEKVDKDFGVDNYARFTMWHTAIRCFLAEEKYSEAEQVSRRLCSELLKPDIIYRLNHQS